MPSMAKSILLLNVEQGPKSGCSLECKASTIATIGRARANTLQISKDFGISQKHVCFQWRDEDEGLGWVAMDMGSSNGTIINDIHVEPHNGVMIQNGDLIKIGAETTIRVEIMGVADEVTSVQKPKRKGTRATSESHGKGMSMVAGKHKGKARDASGKPSAARECHGKKQDVMEGEVYHGKQQISYLAEDFDGKQPDVMGGEDHGKHHINNAAEDFHGNQQDVMEGDGKQQDCMTSYSNHGKHHINNAAEGHGKKQDTMPAYRDYEKQQDTMRAYRDYGKHHISIAAEEGKQKDIPTDCTDPGKRHIDNAAKEGHNRWQNTATAYEDRGKQQLNVASTPRNNEHEIKNVTATAGPIVDLGMTVEQWFQHMMEEGPKYLYQVSEAIIQDVMLESKQFDEYVLSLS